VKPSFAAAILAAAAAEPVLPSVQPGLVLHADGDYFAYACAGSDECPPEVARNAVVERLAKAQRHAGAEHVLIHLSHQATTKGDRGLIATVKPYQGQRDGGRKPVNWRYLREFLESLPNVCISVHREADDSIAEAAHSQPGLVAIYTADKDMRMLPGLHVDWKSYALTRVESGQYDCRRTDDAGDEVAYGLRWFWLQMLQGDTADNIPGLPKCTLDGKQKLCGEKTAQALLAHCNNTDDAFDTVSEQYAHYYGDNWPTMFCEQAMLLWLRAKPEAFMTDFLLHPTLLTREWPVVLRQLITASNEIIKRVKGVKDEAKSYGSESSAGTSADGAEW
jgi:DNA polymerase-1